MLYSWAKGISLRYMIGLSSPPHLTLLNLSPIRFFGQAQRSGQMDEKEDDGDDDDTSVFWAAGVLATDSNSSQQTMPAGCMTTAGSFDTIYRFETKTVVVVTTWSPRTDPVNGGLIAVFVRPPDRYDGDRGFLVG